MFTPMHVAGWSKCRVGRDWDGGYVMLDDFKGVTAAISAGVGDEASWDLEIAERNILVDQYDHTIKKPPVPHPYIEWFPVKMSPDERTLEVALKMFWRVKGDRVLKMDIEGGEWDVLIGVDLSAFRQIVVEFHDLLTISDEKLDRMAATMNAHHQLIHVHGNNYGICATDQIGDVPNVLEATYVRRDDKVFIPETDSYPTPFDRPNNPALHDFKFRWAA
jgi:hypothetical protein